MNDDIKQVSTIKYPEAFLKSLPPGFDGVFDWSYLKGCFGETKIMPADIDAIVERKNSFLLFETKNPGVPVPQGQMITLKRFYALGNFTICIIHGKVVPVAVELWLAQNMGGGTFTEEGENITQKVRQYVTRWFELADKAP